MRLFTLLLILTFTFSSLCAEAPDSSLLKMDRDSTLHLQSKNCKRRGFGRLLAGTTVIAGGVLLLEVGSASQLYSDEPDHSGPILMSAIVIGGGTALSISSIPLFVKSSKLSKESGISKATGKELRISLGYQAYFEKEWRGVDSVYAYQESGYFRGENFKERALRPMPHFTLEVGLYLPSHIYFGIYGEVAYAGAMAVSSYEWPLLEWLSVTAGIKAGYLAEKWACYDRNDHTQYGGPEIRIRAGRGNIRAEAEAMLWIDRVMSYDEVNYNSDPYSYPPSIKKVYVAHSKRTGVSPAVSLKVVFCIPR